MPEPRTGCLSLQCRPSGRRGPPAFGQGVVALQGGPVASKGGSSPAQGAYAHMSAPPEGEGPPFRGGWPACGRVLWLVRAYHCGHPTRGPVHPPRPAAAYTARGLGLLALPGHPPAPALGPGLWGDQGGVGPGCRWRGVGLAGWLWGGAGRPLFN